MKSNLLTPEASFDIRQLPGSERALWNLEEGARRILSSTAVRLIAELWPPPADTSPGDRWDHARRLAFQIWEEVKNVRCQSGLTLDREMGIVGLSGFLTIHEEIVQPLIAAGDLERTLLERRDAIDRQIQVLARRRSGARS